MGGDTVKIVMDENAWPDVLWMRELIGKRVVLRRDGRTGTVKGTLRRYKLGVPTAFAKVLFDDRDRVEQWPVAWLEYE